MRIITENQYKLAQKRVEDLLPLVDDSTPLDDPKAVELMMMSDIVIDYEKEHFPIVKPSVADLIADGLKENHITQKQLAEELGISTTRVNDFVSGKSEPNLKTDPCYPSSYESSLFQDREPGGTTQESVQNSTSAYAYRSWARDPKN
mgnify:CR=1 FL=1